ncbi:hypothetical protein [Heyndrickxia camelliae]|nr:hypothetical protein [Heyndrickxia camelliae]
MLKKIIYVPELPNGVYIETEKYFLVGISEGDAKDERLCPQEGK